MLTATRSTAEGATQPQGRIVSGVRVFFAAPMSGFDSEALYQQHRKIIMSACKELEASSRIASVYFAGRCATTPTGFSDPKDALRSDFAALRDCDLFLLYYPTPVQSSVLVEAGIAMGLGKSCFFACRNASDLPYLLRSAAKFDRRIGLPNIDVWEWKSETVDAALLTQSVMSVATARTAT